MHFKEIIDSDCIYRHYGMAATASVHDIFNCKCIDFISKHLLSNNRPTTLILIYLPKAHVLIQCTWERTTQAPARKTYKSSYLRSFKYLMMLNIENRQGAISYLNP